MLPGIEADGHEVFYLKSMLLEVSLISFFISDLYYGVFGHGLDKFVL